MKPALDFGLRLRTWTQRAARAAPWALAAAVLALAAVYAWVSEDAFITLRTVDHFVSGRGLVWNVGERVQGFTHPSWMFVLSAFYALTREPFYTTVAVSLVTTALLLWLLMREFRGRPHALLLVLLALGASRGFVDWSTSGLENPLTHVLVVSYCWVFYRGATLWQLSLLAALGTLTRPDMALLFAPSLGYASFRAWRRSSNASRRQVLLQLLAGAAPLLLWEAFSLFYYGSLVPNTALAKLNHGIARWDLMRQGAVYLWRCTTYDPVLAAVIAFGLSVLVTTRSARSRCLVAGVISYLMYVVWVGGDFMAGRFLTTPFVVSLVVIGRVSLRWPALQGWAQRGAPCAAIALGLLVLGGLAEHPTLSKSLNVRATRAGKFPNGVADERQFYASRLSLASVWGKPGPKFRWRTRGETLDPKPKPGEQRAVHVLGNIGVTGYYSRLGVTIIDSLALTDPLLARLPSVHRPRWRMGHFGRALPEGYLRSVATGTNHFQDAQLGKLWQDIDLVTRGPLLDAERLRAIVRLNSSAAKSLVDMDRYRYHGAPHWTLRRMSKRPGRVLSAPQAGAFIAKSELGPGPVKGWITPGGYRVVYRSKGSMVAERGLRAKAEVGAKKDTLVRVVVQPPDGLSYDELHILPTRNAGFQLRDWR